MYSAFVKTGSVSCIIRIALGDRVSDRRQQGQARTSAIALLSSISSRLDFLCEMTPALECFPCFALSAKRIQSASLTKAEQHCRFEMHAPFSFRRQTKKAGNSEE